MLINCPVCETFIEADVFVGKDGKEIETRIKCLTCTFEHQYWFGVRRISYKNLKYQVHDDGNKFSNTHIPMKVLFLVLNVRKKVLKWMKKW